MGYCIATGGVKLIIGLITGSPTDFLWDNLWIGSFFSIGVNSCSLHQTTKYISYKYGRLLAH